MSDDESIMSFLGSLSKNFVDRESNCSNRQLKPEGERPCPICGKLMASVEEKGILIDQCAEHGVWLDKGELDAIIERSHDSKMLAAMKARETAEKLDAARRNAD